MEDSKRSGASTDEIYTSTLWYFDLLQFTIVQELPTQSICNIEDEGTENSNHSTEEEHQFQDKTEENNTQVSFLDTYLLKTKKIH